MKQIDLKETMNIAGWRTKNGVIHVMAGNLEEGFRDDADFSRRATLAIPKSWQVENWKEVWGSDWRVFKQRWLVSDRASASCIRSSGNFTLRGEISGKGSCYELTFATVN